jgi:16S rRNA (cytidine1402-2'-O)-methyltransferase
VRAVPGPSAVIAALSIAGVATDRFLFHGFLAQKGGKKRKVLQELLSHPFTVVIYESPRRVKETLIAIADSAPGRLVAVLRELTKVYEEVVRGTSEEVRELVEETDTRGEYVIVIEGQGAVARDNEDVRREDRGARSKEKSSRLKEKGSRKRVGRERFEDYD